MGYTEYRDLYSVVKAGRQAGTSERKVHHERDNSRLTAARISWVSTEVDGRPDALRSPRRTGRGEGRRSFSLCCCMLATRFDELSCSRDRKVLHKTETKLARPATNTPSRFYLLPSRRRRVRSRFAFLLSGLGQFGRSVLITVKCIWLGYNSRNCCILCVSVCVCVSFLCGGEGWGTGTCFWFGIAISSVFCLSIRLTSKRVVQIKKKCLFLVSLDIASINGSRPLVPDYYNNSAAMIYRRRHATT